MKETITPDGIRTEFDGKVRVINDPVARIHFSQEGIDRATVGISPWTDEGGRGPYRPYIHVTLNKNSENIVVDYDGNSKGAIEKIEVDRNLKGADESCYHVSFKFKGTQDGIKVRVVGGEEKDGYRERTLRRSRRLRFGERFVYGDYSYQIVKTDGKILLVVEKSDGSEKFQLSLPESIDVGKLHDVITSKDWMEALEIAKPEYQQL